MAITLKPDTKTQLLASIKRYVAENLDQDIGDLKAGLLLDYVLEEIAPSVYNQAIQDAQRYFQERANDLEGVCFERGVRLLEGRAHQEAVTWSSSSSSRLSRSCSWGPAAVGARRARLRSWRASCS